MNTNIIIDIVSERPNNHELVQACGRTVVDDPSTATVVESAVLRTSSIVGFRNQIIECVALDVVAISSHDSRYTSSISTSMAPQSGTGTGVHLVVLVHGLWGETRHDIKNADRRLKGTR